MAELCQTFSRCPNRRHNIRLLDQAWICQVAAQSAGQDLPFLHGCWQFSLQDVEWFMQGGQLTLAAYLDH